MKRKELILKDVKVTMYVAESALKGSTLYGAAHADLSGCRDEMLGFMKENGVPIPDEFKKMDNELIALINL